MALELIRGTSFPQLLSRLIIDVGHRGIDPRWIVVPTSTCANHVRLQTALCSGDKAVAGVRVISLHRLLRRLASLGEIDAGVRQGPLTEPVCRTSRRNIGQADCARPPVSSLIASTR